MLPQSMVGEFGRCFAICNYTNKKIFLVIVLVRSEINMLTHGIRSIFTISRHLFEHCLAPIGVHGNMVSCSCISAGCPTGGTLDPFLNCPLRKTPQVHEVWFTGFSLSGSIGTGNNDFSLFHSKSMLSLTVGVDA